MAIYHYSVKAISRSTGRSSVAAAAYRSGERLVDERTGAIYDYQRRDGVLHTEVFLPDGETVDREALWNLVEQAEKRKDAKVAREIVVALPHELSQLDQLVLLRDYAKDLSRRAGWAVDVAMHAPGGEGDQRNTHAHILCTTRKVERDEEGQLRMGAKTREWDVVATGKDLVRFERQEWERRVNQMLEIAQSPARVDCRSYADQGKPELMPQTHLGVSACQMERKGIETDRGNRNRAAAEHNQTVVDLAERRRTREIAQAVADKLNDQKRWEAMSVQELDKERQQIDVGYIRQFVSLVDPAVQEAERPLRFAPSYYESGPAWEKMRADYDAGKFGGLNDERLGEKEKAARQAGWALKHSDEQVSQWRKKHPYKAALWDVEVPSKEFEALGRSYEQAFEKNEKAEADLKAFQKAKWTAEDRLENAMQTAITKYQGEYDQRKERVDALKSILRTKQEQERALKREQERGRGGGRSIGF